MLAGAMVVLALIRFAAMLASTSVPLGHYMARVFTGEAPGSIPCSVPSFVGIN